MRLIYLIVFTFIGTLTNAQNQAYYVKQTQVSSDMENFTPLTENSLFTKIVIKSNGVELKSSNGDITFVNLDEIDKVDEGSGYRYELPTTENIRTALFFNPYPYRTSEPKLYMAVVSIPGLVKENPKSITFFRLVFVDDLLK